MLVNLDQSHKHAFLLSLIHTEYSRRLWRDPLVLLKQIYFCLMIVSSFQLTSLKRNLSYKSDDKQIWKLKESYLQMELENYQYTFHIFLKRHLVLKQVYSSLLDV